MRESLPKSKIGKPNSDLLQCLCSVGLFYQKSLLKENYHMLFEENHSSTFFEMSTFEI